MTIILANGDYPTHPIPVKLLYSNNPVVCCDGAANNFIAHGGNPIAIIGDCDSVCNQIRNQYREKLHPIFEQETNDLTKAVNYLIEQGENDIVILGATGKRECHTLGNISLLMKYQCMGIHVMMYTDHCKIIPVHDSIELTTRIGQQISIINYNAHNFRSQGLKYPLYDFNEWWQGTLNECVAQTVSISAKGNYLVLLDYVDPDTIVASTQ